MNNKRIEPVAIFSDEGSAHPPNRTAWIQVKNYTSDSLKEGDELYTAAQIVEACVGVMGKIATAKAVRKTLAMFLGPQCGSSGTVKQFDAKDMQKQYDRGFKKGRVSSRTIADDSAEYYATGASSVVMDAGGQHRFTCASVSHTPVAGEAAERLDAPAQVGGTRFGKGIHWSTVIRAAQHHHQYMQDPKREAERIAQAKRFQAYVAGDPAPQASIEFVSVDELKTLLPGAYYMDPPDGGDVSVFEQLRRMSEDAAKWRDYLQKDD